MILCVLLALDFLSCSYFLPNYIQYLQDHFHWTKDTTRSISWTSLRWGLRRIQRHCVTTKICNGILPTATTLKRWKQQKHDFCVLCGAQETTTHMIRCQHSSRQQWRRHTVTKFRTTMKALNTALHVQDLFCTALTHWFDNGMVPFEQFQDSHQDVLWSQQQIGWIHLFMGHWSLEWEALHGTFQHQETTANTWTASMIETGLQAMIQLWEQRNSDVHGKSELEQKQRLLERQKAVISELLSKQHKCLPKDHFLFPSNPSELLDKTSTVDLGNWILTRKAAILRSERMAQEQAIVNTNPIYTWFQPKVQQTLSKAKQWCRDKLLFEPYNKKKKHKQESQSLHPFNQKSIKSYFSLFQQQ